MSIGDPFSRCPSCGRTLLSTEHGPEACGYCSIDAAAAGRRRATLLRASIGLVFLGLLLAKMLSAQVAPTARFTATCSALSCQFSGVGSTWPNGHTSADARVWDFGDGSGPRRLSTIVTWTYAVAGAYQVRYTITDRLNLSDDTVQTVYVGVAPPPPPPPAAAPGPPGFPGARLTLAQGLGRAVLAYRWFFGDGQRAMTQDTLAALVRRLTGHPLTQRRLSELERAVGAPADSAETASLSMALGLLFDLRADSALPRTLQDAWMAGIRERRRRSLP